MALVLTPQDHTDVIANAVTQERTVNTRSTNVHPIRVNMEEDVWITSDPLLVHATAAIQEGHVRAM